MRSAKQTGSQAGDNAAGDLRIEIVTERARFDTLEHAWNALFERAARPQHVFQRFNWLWHWANHYLERGTRLAVVTGWRGERLVMVWPLVRLGHAPLRRIAWMGEPVSQYGDALVDDCADSDTILRRGWEAARALGADVAHLRKVRADFNAARVLKEGALESMADAAPYLDLASAPDVDVYMKRYPGKIRSTRRRYLRRLQSFGEVTCEQHNPGLMAREMTVQAMRHKTAWVSRQGVIAPVLVDPRFERFFCDVAAGLSHPAPMRVVVVRCNAQAVGVEISLICGKHLFGHVIACDPAFEKKGAGSVLAEYAIAAAHKRGFAVYDLLAPADAYKSDWADATVGVCDFAAPLSVFGALYTRPWFCGLRPRLKRAFDNASPWFGRSVGRLFDTSGRKQDTGGEVEAQQPANQLG